MPEGRILDALDEQTMARSDTPTPKSANSPAESRASHAPCRTPVRASAWSAHFGCAVEPDTIASDVEAMPIAMQGQCATRLTFSLSLTKACAFFMARYALVLFFASARKTTQCVRFSAHSARRLRCQQGFRKGDEGRRTGQTDDLTSLICRDGHVQCIWRARTVLGRSDDETPRNEKCIVACLSL